MKEQGDGVPHSVRVALEQHIALCDGLAGTRHKLSQALTELRRALGITASSERRSSSGNPLGVGARGDGKLPPNKRGQLELTAERCESLLLWHAAMAKKQRQKLKTARTKLMRLPQDPELNDKECSALEEAADDAAVAEHVARLKLGGQAQPALEASSEAFMTGAQVATVEDTLVLPAPADDELDGKVVHTVVDERERFDFSFTVRRITVQVEKKVVVDAAGERSVVSASTAQLGPPRYSVTWDFLTHMTVLVVQYAMPMNRLGTLLSTDDKRFSAGGLSRMLRYVAQRIAPVYLTLFEQLANSSILCGDDTSCRVLEVSRYFAGRDRDEAPSESPWHDYRNTEAACQMFEQGDRSLAVELACELGFEYERRNGDGAKKALHTTTLSGRSDPDDPRSQIVFYRSHLGGFGNLLETLLRTRDPKHRALTIQSDLATVNLVSDKELQHRFTILVVGCTSHARRPFALYEHEDPDSCAHMLELFKGLFIYERGLNIVGRNHDNVLAVRNIDCRELWQEIKELAEDMSHRWSRETKLGEGARYITRHFDKLTAYLDDPRLDITNNFSERMLRMEKLIQASSLFRTSIEGRCALDILRTVLQTAIAAHAPLQPYLLSILRASPDEVASAPERFTPRAWAAANLVPSIESGEVADAEPPSASSPSP